MTGKHELDELLGMIAESATEVLHGDFSTLFLYDSDQQKFVNGVRRGKIAFSPSMPGDSGLTAQLARQQKPVFIEEVDKDPRINPALASEKSIISFAGVPLMYQERTVGVLYVNFCERHRFATQDREMIGLLASQAAVAIENARLYGEMERRVDEGIKAAEGAQERAAAAEKLAVMSTAAAEFAHKMNNLAGTIPGRVKGGQGGLGSKQPERSTSYKAVGGYCY